MAGAGYKLFVSGDVLTAAQVNTYLNEQTVMVFATSAARTSALSAVLAEGMMSYLQDSNTVYYYDGAAWNALASGDITAITAGNGISVTSGTGPIPTVAIDTAVTVDKTTAQTLTNKTLTSPALTTPTISTLTTNGDLLYGTGSGALSRLNIGSSAQILTVTGGVPVWATAAGGGGMTLLSTTSLSSSATISGISGSYKTLVGVVYGMLNNTADGEFTIKPNNSSLVYAALLYSTSSSSSADKFYASQMRTIGNTVNRASAVNAFTFVINNYAATDRKPIQFYGTWVQGDYYSINAAGSIQDGNAITSLVFANSGGTLTAGTVLLYGVS